MLSSGIRTSRFSARWRRRFSTQTRRPLHEIPHINDRQRRQNADPQQAAPANRGIEQPVGGARQEEADAPRPLQYAAHEPARSDRPLLHRQGAPAGHSAPMKKPSRARNRNQKVGEKPAMKLHSE